MNGKKIAALLLVMIIAGVAYGAQMIQKRSSAMRQEASSAKDDYEAAQDKRKNKNIELQRIDYDTKDLRQFLQRWQPAIDHIQTGQEAEQALMSVTRNSGVLIMSQKFEVKDNRNELLVPKTLQGTLTAQDEYSKTMNWLGDLERKIPLIRVNACRIKQGENGRQINMEIHFEIPLVNLDAELEQPKK